MIEIRRDAEIHREDGGWVVSRWHFSFAGYRDPAQMGLGPLRVFNDDILEAGAIWPLHHHRDVEGISYIPEGHFKHQDSLGNNGIFEQHGVQRMTLGRGAEHSEQNASGTEPVRFIQLWILPDTADLEPEVEQRQFTREEVTDRLRPLLAPVAEAHGERAGGGEGDGAAGAVGVHQDARMYAGWLNPGVDVTHSLPDGRGAYVYLMDGLATFDGEAVGKGDAAKVFGPHELRITSREDAHVIVVDVPLDWEPVGVWARG